MLKYGLIAAALIVILGIALTFSSSSVTNVLYACSPECGDCDLASLLWRRYAAVFLSESSFGLRERCGMVLPVQWHLRGLLFGLGIVNVGFAFLSRMHHRPIVQILGWLSVVLSLGFVVLLSLFGLLSLG